MIKKYLLLIIFTFFFFSYHVCASETSYYYDMSSFNTTIDLLQNTLTSDSKKTIYENLEERISYYEDQDFKYLINISSSNISSDSSFTVYLFDTSLTDLNSFYFTYIDYTSIYTYKLSSSKPIYHYECSTSFSSDKTSCDYVFETSSKRVSNYNFFTFVSSTSGTFENFYSTNLTFTIGDITPLTLQNTLNGDITLSSTSDTSFYKYLFIRNYIIQDLEPEKDFEEVLKEKYTSGFNNSLVPTFFSLIAHIVGVCVVIIAVVKALQFFFTILKKG